MDVSRLPLDTPPLVGRERERALLRAHLVAALAGRGSLILIGGEAGIGKTSLAEAACAEAGERGALVLVGRCYDLSETPPYGPWADLFARYRPGADAPPAPAAFARRGTVGAVASQAALVEQVAAFLADLAGGRPLVLLLDDLHWADPASLELLRAVARDAATLPLLLLATYRADELTRRHPLYQLLPTLVREARAERLDLRPLDEGALRTLVERYALPPAAAARLAAYLGERAEGNPFFLGELLRALEEHGALHDPGRVPIPPLLRQVIDGRVARLGEAARAALAIAATVGPEVPLALWAAVARADEAALWPIVEAAVEAQVLTPTADGAAVRFVHALIREALYEGILAPRRRDWHRRTADALLAGPAPPDPDAVAYHLARAGDGRAAGWLVAAGERAERAYAWPTAAQRYEDALARLAAAGAGAATRGWLLFRIATLRRFEDPRGNLAALAEAERCGAAAGDAALAAYARFQRGLLHCMGLDFRRGLPLLEGGIAALDALAPADFARLRALPPRGDPLDRHRGRGELALWYAESGRFARAVALGEAILAAPPDPADGPDGSTGDAGYALGWAYAALGRPEEASRAFARARAALLDTGHRIMAASAIYFELLLVTLPYRADRPRAAQRLVAAAAAMPDGIPVTRQPQLLAWYLSAMWAVHGRWDELCRFADVDHAGANRAIIASLAGPIWRARGDPERAWAAVQHLFPDGPGAEPGDFPSYASPLLRLAAQLHLDAGDRDGARAWLAAHDRYVAWSGSLLDRTEGHLAWAFAHRAAGEVDAAHAAAQRALAAAGEPRQPLALLAAHRLLGELTTAAGRFAEASTHLETALALAEACRAPFERARTLLAIAALRREEGDAPTARALAEAARALCVPLGAAPTIAAADTLLASLAAPRTPGANPDGLTGREVEVLRLLAAGRSNAEIADALFLSVRTVDRHVANIYDKSGARGRAAATAYALRHALA